MMLNGAPSVQDRIRFDGRVNIDNHASHYRDATCNGRRMCDCSCRMDDRNGDQTGGQTGIEQHRSTPQNTRHASNGNKKPFDTLAPQSRQIIVAADDRQAQSGRTSLRRILVKYANEIELAG